MKAGKQKKKIIVGIFSCIFTALSLFAGANKVYADETAGNQGIVIDGDVSEWGGMASLPSNDAKVEEWRLAKSNDGKTLYLAFNGIAVSEWYGDYQWLVLNITYNNGTSSNYQIATITQYWELPGAMVEMKNYASGNTQGNYGVECMLPVREGGYSITFAGTTVSSDNIPLFTAAEEDDTEPVYNGIAIDGKFKDWNAVTKTPVTEYVDSVACVFDGDYVYIYIQDGTNGEAQGAGPNSNGKYAIVTDLGRNLLFELRENNGIGYIQGIEGAQAAHFGNEWEIEIPAAALPLWKESISFGLYLMEPWLSNIMNLRADEGYTGTAGQFSGITYDGLYGDWNAYPHTVIEYATPGTQDINADAEGALYSEDGILYGHVITRMKMDRGDEFGSAISICFNGRREYNGDKTWNYYPRFVTVSQDGTINWNAIVGNLPNGTHEFYIADVRGEYDTNNLKNLSDLQDYEQFVGKMMVTISDSCEEMEFYIDLSQVAAFLSHYSGNKIYAGDFQLIEAQFGRIGQQYLSVAGTSSGPYLGIALAIGVTGVILFRRRKHKGAAE